MGALDNHIQGALNPIVNILNDARAQFHAQGRPGGLHRSAGAQAAGLLIDLDRGSVAGHSQYLTDQPLLTHTDHIRHVGVSQAVGHDQRAGNLNDFTLTHSFTAFLEQFRMKLHAQAAHHEN